MSEIEKKKNLTNKRERGQSLVEYALIVGLIVVVVIALLTQIGQGVSEKFRSIASALNGS